ncbi:hypothetical protein [Streptomyces ipomoeae]|uniref:hypothetical protein n=1 Tax=Streptomyces ipomoeae TaxID=103232 RepID=UPI0029B9A607|nr:hypothetical protein [Streptomyces ipomoeae]MDX2700340.1 hypothetical protein [Streptomyces ipomoeae]MDX2845964.1 hypothetical protein [Streptomyces ipomoeae]
MSGIQIVTSVLSLAAGVGMVAGARALGASRYPAGATYAAFRADTSTASLPVVECEGTCSGATTHENHGDGTATCTTCGTPRTAPVPDPAS